MRTTAVTPEDLSDVFAVPPLARKADAQRTIDFDENERLLRHMQAGGLTRFLYGGNAFLYHISLGDYEALLGWLGQQPGDRWMIPSVGSSYGRAMDQARLLRRYAFPCVMVLPCHDPRDAAGLEQGLREISDAAGTRLILYLKDTHSFGADTEAGLDAVARLVDEGLCVGIKYAVVRPDPAEDAYLASLLARVDRRLVISGIGERPAVVHLCQWKLAGFTTGSGCLQPRLCRSLLEACRRGDYATAETLRQTFLPLEDLRDAWNPARVLHAATALAGVAETGPVLPYLSPLSHEQRGALLPVAQTLARAHEAAVGARS